MSKVLFAFVIGLALCVPLASSAQAQTRLGPAEDDTPAVSAPATTKSDEKKSDAKKESAKTDAPAASATPKPN
ncbi:MAG TPA: hypothetical protein VGO96_15390, partial [Pyrinomonadaceae bacterium]|nr:hypothetical protein [Pyrinomonadaceae bacterium]